MMGEMRQGILGPCCQSAARSSFSRV